MSQSNDGNQVQSPWGIVIFGITMHTRLIWILVATASFLPSLGLAQSSDPTRPFNVELNIDYANLFEEEKLDTDIVLQAITKSKKKKVAVINNIVVHEGDEILGYKVKKIKSDSVVLKNDTETRDLNINMVAKIKD